MDLKGIKNIIFDLGNVIIDIDPNKVVQRFQSLLNGTFPKLEKDIASSGILEKYETAEISTAEFISFFKSYDSALTTQEVIEAWNSMLLDIPKERLELIEGLSKEYRVFLLSNTNELHLNYIDDYVAKKFQMKLMSDPFEKAYYSHKMKLRKPNPEIFNEILKDKNLIAKETLFIDDSEEHIVTAKGLNLKTHHLLDDETIIDIFHAN